MSDANGGHWGPPDPLPGRTILHTYFASFELHQSRAARMGLTALQHGFADTIIYAGHDYPGATEFSTLIAGSVIWNAPVPAYQGPLSGFVRVLTLPLWWYRIFRTFRNYRFTALHCHSLAALPVAAALKRRTGAPLIYDANELETERPGWRWPTRKLAHLVERLLIRRADQVLVVSESIAEWYRRSYPGVPVTAVRNLPVRPTKMPAHNERLRQRFGIPPGELIFLYTGLIGMARGIDTMLVAFSRMPKDRHLIFLGAGPFAEAARAAARQHPNIHVHEPVPYDEMLEIAAGADVGVVIMEPTSLSYRYGLPNKLFEYICAGLPVIGNDIPEVRRIIEETGRGWILKSVDPDAFEDLVMKLTPKEISPKSAMPPDGLFWDIEERKFTGVLKDVLGNGRVPPSR